MPKPPTPHKIKPLTPYDTGAVLEPKLWVDPANPPDEGETQHGYGRVDFDDDEGATRLTLVARPDALECALVLNVDWSGIGPEKLSVVVNGKEAAVVDVNPLPSFVLEAVADVRANYPYRAGTQTLGHLKEVLTFTERVLAHREAIVTALNTKGQAAAHTELSSLAHVLGIQLDDDGMKWHVEK